jgi:glycosyltransferase involved in cell wall biosynthesis
MNIANKDIKNIHLPVYTRNPYNQRIADALAQVGGCCDLYTDLPALRNSRVLLARLKQYDIVHWHWLNGFYQGNNIATFVIRSCLFASVMVELKLRKIPQVITVHNLLPHEHHFGSLHRLMTRVIGNLSDRLLVHHPHSLAPVAALYGNIKKIRIIPHVDYGDSTIEMQKNKLRKRWGLDCNKKWAIVFGAVRKYKCIEHVACIAGQLKKKGVGVIVAGDCPDLEYKHMLQKTADGSIFFISRYLKDLDIDELLAASDIVLLPYSDALTSGAAHLAVARNKLIVSGLSHAFYEFVERGLCFSVDTSVPEQFLSAVLKTIDQSKSLNENSYEKFRSERKPEIIGKMLLEVYGELLHNLKS